MMKYIIKEVSKNLYLIRFDDARIKYFEGIWEIPEGVTYNSYVYIGEKNIVFDTVKSEYAKEYINALNEIIKPNRIDYLIIHHAEPDHTGALPLLTEKIDKELKIIGHPLTIKILKNIYGYLNFEFKPVNDGERIIKGKTDLISIYSPWLHWPETMMSYFANRRILLTCDVFGGYSIPDTIDDADMNMDDYIYYMKKYLVTVIGSYIEWIPKLLDKFDKIGVLPKMILPSHGIIWNRDSLKVIELYKRWSTKIANNEVFILYTTMYGTSKRIADYIKDIIERQGFNVDIEGFDDRSRPYISDILAKAFSSTAYVFITPTYESDIHPLMKTFLLNLVEKIRFRKPVLIISPYGWSGVAGKKIYDMLSKRGFNNIVYLEISGDIETNKKKLSEAVYSLLKLIN